jgi:hypothetical protein
LSSGDDGPPDCPYDEIVNAYHEALPMLPRVKVMTKTRKAALRARWRESKKRQNVDYWRRYFEHAAKSDLITGKVPPKMPGNSPWRADFEWLITEGNFVKVIEGKYE